MTSRERVRKVLNREIPDRVPIDIGANCVTGFCVDGYTNLVKYLGYDELLPPTVYDHFGMLARMDEKVLKRLHCDVVQLENISYVKWGIENKDWKPWVNQAGNTVLMPGEFDPQDEGDFLYIVDKKSGKKVARMPKGGHYFDYCDSLNMTMGDFEHVDLKELRDSISLYSDEHLRLIEAEGKRLYEDTDFAVCGGFAGGGFSMAPSIAGHPYCDWLCLLALEPDYCYEVLKTIAEREAENFKMYLQACGKYLDLVTVSITDFGNQNSAMISPDTFKELYVPNYRIITECGHANTDAKLFFHSCGSVFDLYEHFVAAGADIINPIQIGARNMDPVAIKEKFGDKLILWGGGIDTQHVLPSGTVDDVKEAVKQAMDVFKPGGGYVFNQVHCIQDDAPPENVLAMVDTAYELAAY